MNNSSMNNSGMPMNNGMSMNNGMETEQINGGRRYDLDHNNHQPDEAHRKIQDAGSLSISPELFEKIYLSPWKQTKGDLSQTFGNPTAIAVGGFTLALAPLSNILSDFRGSGGLGASEIGGLFFFGGLLMIIGGVLEFVLGNTFPSVAFCLFGAFFLSLAASFQPFFDAAQFFAKPGTPEADAILNVTFLSSFAFFWIYMAVLSFILFLGALRTNLVFLLIFLLLIPFFSCLAQAFYRFAEGDLTSGKHFQHAAGGLGFAVSILGFYLFLHLIFAAVDFPIALPVCDLSRHIKGRADLEKAKEERKKNGDEEADGLKRKFWKRS